MKKLILVITAIACLNLGMYANTGEVINNRTTQTELVVNVHNSETGTEEIPVQPKDELSKKEQRKQRKAARQKLRDEKSKGWKDLSIGAKIAIGVGAALVLLLFIVTGGEGYSSR